MKKRCWLVENYIVVITFLIFSLTIGFAALETSLGINVGAKIRVKQDIRITNISVSGSSSGALSNGEEYNVKSISSNIDLPNNNSTITYDIEITNIGNTNMGILSISNLPSNLTYSISNYTLKDKLCDDTNTSQCNLGSVTTLHVTIMYAQNGYNSSNTNYNIR